MMAKKLPSCPWCHGISVHVAWDSKTHEAYIQHDDNLLNPCGREFRSPSRKTTEAAWIACVTERRKNLVRWNAPMIWDGFNTRQVVAYCIAWQYDLCGIYSIGPSCGTQEPVLCIEPADTMRGSCLNIHLNDAVVRVHSTWKYHNHNGKLTGHDQYIKVMHPDEWCFEPWAPPLFKRVKYPNGKVEQDPEDKKQYVLKLDRSHFYPKVNPDAPYPADYAWGLPIGGYHQTPTMSTPFTLFPPGIPMPYSQNYDPCFRKNQGVPDT